MRNGIQRRNVVAAGLTAYLAFPEKLAAAVAPAEMNALAVPSLREAYGDIFQFGAAITPGQVSFSATELIKRHFSVVVAENAMKPIELADKRVEGQYNFGTADDIVNFALSNGIKVRGHTLLWHNQYAPWFFDGADGQEVSRDVLVKRMEKYIADVVGHFRGRVYAWDVVNEAFSFGESGVSTDENGLRMSSFRRIIGPEFIEIAFNAAAKADPDALLFYNDYETQNPRKTQAIVAMVNDFKTRGIKIDGIGHQTHCSMGHPSIGQLEAAIVRIGELGVTQHITEMDVALNNTIFSSDIAEATPRLLDAQGAIYGAFFQMFVRHRRLISAVLLWGIDDSGSWLRSWPTKRFEAPLIFDDLQRAKPAYWAVLDEAKVR